MKNVLLLSLTLTACAVADARGQNLLQNGDFELPGIDLNTYTPGTPTGWDYPGLEGLLFNGNGGDGTTWPLPQHGSQYAYIGNDLSGPPLRQTFSVSIPVKDDYALVWYDSSGHSGDAAESSYSVRLTDNAGTHEVLAESYDAFHATPGEWVQRSKVVTLTNGTYILNFQPKGYEGGLGTLIDNVSLTPANLDVVTDIKLTMNICWPGQTNYTYQLQYVTSAASTNWVNVGSPVQGAGTNCFDDVVAPESRYYRLVRVP